MLADCAFLSPSFIVRSVRLQRYRFLFSLLKCTEMFTLCQLATTYNIHIPGSYTHKIKFILKMCISRWCPRTKWLNIIMPLYATCVTFVCVCMCVLFYGTVVRVFTVWIWHVTVGMFSIIIHIYKKKKRTGHFETKFNMQFFWKRIWWSSSFHPCFRM